MQLPQYDTNGKATSKINVSDVVFGAQENAELLHQAYVFHRANQRQGNGSTLTRGMVSGTGLAERYWPGPPRLMEVSASSRRRRCLRAES